MSRVKGKARLSGTRKFKKPTLDAAQKDAAVLMCCSRQAVGTHVSKALNKTQKYFSRRRYKRRGVRRYYQ
jgi:hypothetical protein